MVECNWAAVGQVLETELAGAGGGVDCGDAMASGLGDGVQLGMGRTHTVGQPGDGTVVAGSQNPLLLDDDGPTCLRSQVDPIGDAASQSHEVLIQTGGSWPGLLMVMGD